MKTVVLGSLLGLASADFYMHNPAGGNDRNRERNQNRNNDNRLFDSQNNGNGGYPWRGDREVTNAADPMVYYEGSDLAMDWTLQHACGADPSTYCQVVIQYACEEYSSAAQLVATGPNADDRIGVANSAGLRDGYPSGPQADAGGNNGQNNANIQYKKATFTVNGNAAGTDTIPFNANNPSQSAQTEFGMHETFGFYEACTEQQRNKGLYTADQNLNRNDARATRQNPNGNRRGLECPEERDYYPSWHPSPWKDAAILASSEEFCPYFQARSQNTVDRNYCTGATGAENNKQPINENGCKQNGGTWNTAQSWAAQGYAVGPPECKMHAASKQNHLGNAAAAYDASMPGEKETMASYDFKMPTMKAGVDHMMCVVRARYNISTNDYPSVAGMTAAGGGTVFSQVDNCANGNANNGGGAAQDQGVDGIAGPGGDPAANCVKTGSGARPLYNRPYVTPFAGEADLGIALNTDQSGRTFQDRSFVFRVAKRPAGVSASANIVNLNTRGARGNIVQAYPRVEYDFVPQSLAITEDDYVHVQWSGSDFNTKRNPNNAEGWQYADRANLVETINENQQFPMAETRAGFFTKQEAMEVTLQGQDELLLAKGAEPTQRATNPTIAGKYNDGTTPRHCGYFTDNNNGNMDEDNDPRNCGKLNFAKAHFQLGGSSATGLKQASAGTYAFVDTRNNNFSNRSQKMTISVAPGAPKAAGMSAAQVAGLVFGIGIPVVCIAILALAVAGAVVAVIATGSGGAVLAFLKSGGKSAGDVADGTSASGPTKPTKSGGPPKPAQRGGPPAKPSQRGGPPAKPGKRGGPPPKPGKR